MFDIGWTEIMVIVAVAVIVVGPKDIPKMLRTVGKYLKKARTMMRDVRRQVEDVVDIAEIKELKATAENIKKDMGVDSFDDPMKMGSATKTTEPAAAKEVTLDVVKEKSKAKPKTTRAKATPKPRSKPAATKTVAKKPAPKRAAPKKAATKATQTKTTAAKKAPAKKPVKTAAQSASK